MLGSIEEQQEQLIKEGKEQDDIARQLRETEVEELKEHVARAQIEAQETRKELESLNSPLARGMEDNARLRLIMLRDIRDRHHL